MTNPQNSARHDRMVDLLSEHRSASAAARASLTLTGCAHDDGCDCPAYPDARTAQVWATLALAAATALDALARLDCDDRT